MIKKIILLLLCLSLISPAAYAKGEAEFSGTVKGEQIEITITAKKDRIIRAFVYTSSVSGAGHSLLHHVEKTDIMPGESKKLVITPPEDGYTKKLVVADRFTLLPVSTSYAYPYIMNVFAKGYLLTDVGTVTEGDKTYASNTFEIDASSFVLEEEPEPSILSLSIATANP